MLRLRTFWVLPNGDFLCAIEHTPRTANHLGSLSSIFWMSYISVVEGTRDLISGSIRGAAPGRCQVRQSSPRGLLGLGRRKSVLSVGLGKAAVCAGLKCYGGKIIRNDAIGDSHRPGHRGRDFRADEQLLSLSLIVAPPARDSRSCSCVPAVQWPRCCRALAHLKP